MTLKQKHFREKLNIDIENVDEIELNNSNINYIEDKAFHGAKFLQKINLEDNKIEKLDYNMVNCINCVDCYCLRQLCEINLSQNQIAEIHKHAFYGLISLRKIWLSFNKISSINQLTFIKLISLNELYLNNNQIEKIENATFNHLKNLQLLDLSSNKIQEIEKASFHKLESLKEIRLEGNQLENLDPLLFFGLKNLKRIYLHSNKFLNDKNNKLELYLEENVLRVALYLNSYWADNNINLIKNLVKNFFFIQSFRYLSFFVFVLREFKMIKLKEFLKLFPENGLRFYLFWYLITNNLIKNFSKTIKILDRIDGKYETNMMIGEGSFGKVYKVQSILEPSKL